MTLRRTILTIAGTLAASAGETLVSTGAVASCPDSWCSSRPRRPSNRAAATCSRRTRRPTWTAPSPSPLVEDGFTVTVNGTVTGILNPPEANT
jgi:hypothetical protein